MRRRTQRTGRLAVAVAAIALGVSTAAQQTRDAAPSRTSTTGTSAVVGTLVSDEATPRPVRRATIRLTGSGTPFGQLAVTDDDGRFAFNAISAGSFSLVATKVGYVTTYYGSKRPGRGPGVAIAVAAGQRMPIAMKMARGAVITGTVLDPFGQPAAQASVMALAYPSSGGEPSLIVDGSRSMVVSDDRGVYRIFGLAPGTYAVSVISRPIGASGEVRPAGAAEIEWARQQLAGSAGRPAAAPTGRSASLPAANRPVGFAPVYFPGTTDVSAAVRITLQAGEERGGVGLTLQYVPTATISGSMLDSSGQVVPNSSLTLLPKSLSTTQDIAMLEMGMLANTRRTVSNGQFTFAGVTPGTYTLVARAGARPPAGPGGPAPGSTPQFWGETEVTISGQDLTDVVVTLRPGITVRGRIAFAGAPGTPRPDASRVRVTMQFLHRGPLVSSPNATMGADGTFTIAGVAPGQYNIRALSGATPGTAWQLESVIAEGVDVADAPLVVAPGNDVSDVVVKFIDRTSAIAGTLLDAAGKPTPDFSIVVFATNRALWTSNSRRIRAIRPASNGTFSIKGLPAGDYRMAAVTDYEPNEIYDPAFLEQLEAASFKFSLAEGEKKTQDMKVAG